MNTEAKVRERPILFSGEMVRALLDGRKTQTRRVIKTPLPNGPYECGWNGQGFAPATAPNEFGGVGCHCRKLTPYYGAPGDRLWVRETWAVAPNWDSIRIEDLPKELSIVRRALNQTGGKWRSSIHMPWWASRLTLELTDVRVQRVQEISEADAIAEGVNEFVEWDGKTARDCFAHLWDSINAKRGYDWASNPWVWVLTFQRAR